MQTVSTRLLGPRAGLTPPPSPAAAASPIITPLPDKPPADEVQIGPLAAHRLKFEFFYDRVMQSSRGATFIEGDRARSLSQELYQRVSGRFSLDLTFLTTLADQSGRAAAIDRSVYEKFVAAAGGLADFDPRSLREFSAAADELFNAAEQALGLGSDGLDAFAALVKQAVTGFFGEIHDRVAAFEKTDEQARAAFAADLRDLLHPEAPQQAEFQPLEAMLAAAAVPEKQRAALRKLAAVVARISGRDQTRRADLLEKLHRRLSRLAQAPQPPGDQPDRTARLYEYTRSAERVEVRMLQNRLDLEAA